jgi:iron complex outermembrane receptor protein
MLFSLVTILGQPDSTINLETLVVSANRTEQRIENTTVSVDVLPQRLLTSKTNSKIEQVIQMSPGVTIQDGQANIRSGSGWSLGAGSRVLVLIDDLPLLSPDAGGAIWNAMPMEAIDQIEIVKGAASSLYGSSALNGVIHLRTWEPTEKMRLRVSTMTEIYDRAKIKSLNWTDQRRAQGAIRFAYSDSKGKNNEHGWVLHGQAFNDQGFQYLVGDKSVRVHGKYRYKPSNNLEMGLNANVWSSDRSSSLIWEDYRDGYIPLDSSATITQSNLGSINGYLKIRNGRLLQTFRARWLGYENISGLDTNNYDNSSNAGHLEYLNQFF